MTRKYIRKADREQLQKITESRPHILDTGTWPWSQHHTPSQPEPPAPEGEPEPPAPEGEPEPPEPQETLKQTSDPLAAIAPPPRILGQDDVQDYEMAISQYGIRVRGEVRRLLSDPMVQLLVMVARVYPHKMLKIKRLNDLNYPLSRRPPTVDLLHKLGQLAKLGLIQFAKEGSGITISVPADLELPIDAAGEIL